MCTRIHKIIYKRYTKDTEYISLAGEDSRIRNLNCGTRFIELPFNTGYSINANQYTGMNKKFAWFCNHLLIYGIQNVLENVSFSMLETIFFVMFLQCMHVVHQIITHSKIPLH